MSKVWISAAFVTVIVGTASGVLLTTAEKAAVPPKPQQLTSNEPRELKPNNTSASAATPALAQIAPQTQPETSVQYPHELTLWDQPSLVASESNGIPVHETLVAPELLQTFAVGQTLTLAVPGRQQPLRATLSETRNNGGAAVWQGKLLNGSDSDSLTLVKGALETHITVATLDGTVSMIIDNATGKTVITDENELVLRATPNDTMPFDASELPPLAPPTQG